MRHPDIYIAQSFEKGRGVFAKAAIPADSILEIAPVILLSAIDRKKIDQTILYNYIFEWPALEERGACMALGWVPIFNHASPSNCEYCMHWDEQTIEVKTVKNIQAGEELFINYNGDWFDEHSPVWFPKK